MIDLGWHPTCIQEHLRTTAALALLLPSNLNSSLIVDAQVAEDGASLLIVGVEAAQRMAQAVQSSVAAWA